MMRGRLKKFISYSGVGVITILASQAFASGYKLEFQSASVLADSGEAAVVEDAGTNWYNSAGLVYLPQQLVFSGIEIYQSTNFSGTATAPSMVPGFGFSANGNATSYPTAFLPAFHYSLPFAQRWALGVSVVPAWGLLEDYGPSSIVRYDLTRVYTRTLDISPSLAYKINDHWSLGAGPDMHYMYVSSNNRVRTQGITVGDSISRFSANSWNYGAHAGILYRYDDATRIGLNYRTKIVQQMSGYSDFALNGIATYESNGFNFKIPLPPITTLSVYHDMNPRWAMMGTISYDQWSVLNNYHGQNYITPTGVLPNVSVQQSMSNTFDYGIGTHYVLNDKLMLRANVKYQPTPTQSRYRDINNPDAPKLGFQVGARYQINPKLAMDMLYGHVFTRTVAINGVNTVTGATTVGQVRTGIDLVGAQLVWDI